MTNKKIYGWVRPDMVVSHPVRHRGHRSPASDMAWRRRHGANKWLGTERSVSSSYFRPPSPRVSDVVTFYSPSRRVIVVALFTRRVRVDSGYHRPGSHQHHHLPRSVTAYYVRPVKFRLTFCLPTTSS